MNEYLVNKADLDAVADAINNLIKSTTPLVFPDDFISKLSAVNVVTYTCKFETYYCTTTAKPSSLTDQSTFDVTVTANEGYILPSSIYATGCEYSWDSKTGVLHINKVLDNVHIKITCVGIYTVTYNLDGCSLYSGPRRVTGTGDYYVHFTLNEGRRYPDDVTVKNATLAAYIANSEDFGLIFRNPTGNVTITQYCLPYSFTVNASSEYVSNIGTYIKTIEPDETKTISITAKSGYNLSAKGVNCTATLTQGATTWKYTLTVSGATGPATVSIIGFAT